MGILFTIMTNLDIREQLSEILNERPTGTIEQAFQLVERQANTIVDILRTRRYIPDGVERNDFLLNVNCHAFSLQAYLSERIMQRIRSVLRGNLITGDIVNNLIQDHFLNEITYPVEGNIIIYYDNDRIMHSGIIRAKQNDSDYSIDSKWGNLPVIEHRVWQVPLGYGNTVRYFIPNNLEQLESLI